MLDHFGGPPVAPVPRRCPEVQFLNSFGAFMPQEAVQDIGEEVVVTVPAPLVVEWDDEEIGALELFKDQAAVAVLGVGR